jgi:CrcB protein
MNLFGLSLLVAAGGALGALSRFWVGQWMVHSLGQAAPWATLLVNLAGCGMAGAFLGWASLRHDFASVHALVLVGFLGGLTTFSSFSLDALKLWLEGQERLAALYVAGNLVGSLLTAAIGWWVIRRIL